jgi:hypothetical protein
MSVILMLFLFIFLFSIPLLPSLPLGMEEDFVGNEGLTRMKPVTRGTCWGGAQWERRAWPWQRCGS